VVDLLPKWTIVGFAGHRDISNSQAISSQIGALLEELREQHGTIIAVCSLAKGADTLFVEELLKRGIQFSLILPFPRERFQQDFETKDWQRVAPLFASAFHIEEVNGAEAGEAYMETGVHIVDNADLLIAVWDGEPSGGLGGTADVVAYARDLSKPIEWIHARTGEVVCERGESLPVVNPPVEPCNNPRRVVETHFQELDAKASLRAPKVRHLLQRIVLLHLIASASGLAALALDIRGAAGYAIAILEVAVLGAAFALSLTRNKKHAEWMNTRIETEICRSFLATWPIRGHMTRFPQPGIRGFERLTRVLRLLQQMDDDAEPTLESASLEYLKSRIEDQIDYFSRRYEQAQSSFRRLRRWAMTSTVGAALLAASHFGLSLFHVEGPATTATELFSLILPLVSAALFSLILTQEYSRRASRNGEMVLMLQAAAQQLKAIRTWNGLVRLASDTEEQLVHEAVEWQLFRRFASDPH
jgi:hypothetical protein